jgi:hypothetical protein
MAEPPKQHRPYQWVADYAAKLAVGSPARQQDLDRDKLRYYTPERKENRFLLLWM